MKKSDISQIKLGSAAFTSKWWKDRRAVFVRGCGVAKALDRWQRDCPANPEKILFEPDQHSARKAAWDLIVAMDKAKKKAGKLAKDTAVACDVYIKLANAYRDSVGKDVINWAQAQVQIRKAETELAKIGREIQTTAAGFAKIDADVTKIAGAAKQLARSGSPGGAQQLLDALGKIRARWSDLAKKTDRELSLFPKVANPAEDICREIVGTQHEKEVRGFRALVETISKDYEALRTQLNSTDEAIRLTEKTISGTAGDMEALRQKLEDHIERIWENPVADPKKLSDQIQSYTRNMREIAAADAGALGDGDVKQFRDMMARIHQDVLKLDANMANFARMVKGFAADLKRYPKDARFDGELKQALAGFQVIQKLRAGFETERKKADQKLSTLA